MSFFKKFAKKFGKSIAFGAVAPVLAGNLAFKKTGIGKKTFAILKPLAKSAALVVPGAGAVAEGIDASDRILRMYNSLNPAKRREAQAIVNTTKLVATQSKDPAIRQGAANGLTLLKKLASGKRAASQATIDAKGYVVPRGVANMRVA